MAADKCVRSGNWMDWSSECVDVFNSLILTSHWSVCSVWSVTVLQCLCWSERSSVIVWIWINPGECLWFIHLRLFFFFSDSTRCCFFSQQIYILKLCRVNPPNKPESLFSYPATPTSTCPEWYCLRSLRRFKSLNWGSCRFSYYKSFNLKQRVDPVFVSVEV